MNKTGYKTAYIEKSGADEAKREVTGWASTCEVDECGDVMVPQGVDTGYLDKHKSINLGHSRDPRDAIGSHRNAKIFKDRGVLVKFAVGTSEVANEAWKMMQEQLLNCLSIEFEGVDFGRPTGVEFKQYGANAGCIYRKWKMRGYALVGQPMNAGAVITDIKCYKQAAEINEFIDRRLKGGHITVDTAKRLGWSEDPARLVIIPNGWVLRVAG